MFIYRGDGKLNILAITFSSRKNGNCTRCAQYCLDKFKIVGHTVELINIFDFNIQGCGLCNYDCFYGNGCLIKDDTLKVYEKCFNADKIIFAIPTYCGNLSSAYFKFWERTQGVFKDNHKYEKDFLSKINFIIIGNLTSGGDMAAHEGLYSFVNRNFYPETIILSSREYNKKSINGDLVDSLEVVHKLDNFAQRILKN